MSNPKLLLAVAVSNVLIIGLCFATYGMDAEGAGVATRSTARFAICFFLAGFAAPGLGKWLPWYPEGANLIQAFVAAQMVHFCSVIALHTKFATSHCNWALLRSPLFWLVFPSCLEPGSRHDNALHQASIMPPIGSCCT